MDRLSNSATRLRVVFLLAVLGFVFNMACFYPGAMSYDDAVTWSRVRGTPTDNVGGVGLLGLWRLTEPLITGPGGPFTVVLALFWASLGIVAKNLRLTWPRTILFACGAYLAPVCFLMFSRMGTDTALMAALTGVLAALLQYRDRGRGGWLLVAAILGLWCLTLRHNAAPALLPFAVYGGWLWKLHHPRPMILSGRGEGFAIAALAFFALLATSLVLDRCVDERRTVFSATALWDLAAVSVQVKEVLLPPATHGPGLDVDDLAQAVEPYANTPLFTRTHAGMRSPFLAPDNPLNSEIRHAWLMAIANHPLAYAAQRWRVMRGLFGVRPRSWPSELVYFDGAQPLNDNPPMTPNATALHAWCVRAFEAFRDTLVFAAWPYLVIALIAGVVAWRRRQRMEAWAALTVVASGLLYALPLTIIAPSTEIRYTGWTCLAAMLGLGLALSNSRKAAATGPTVE